MAVILVWFYSTSLIFLLPVPLLLLAINIFQSFRICSGYYIKASCRIPEETNGVCLTFDDGPSENIPSLLFLLEKYNAKATFFLTGKKIEKFPEHTSEIISRGHTIGNHSYSHGNFFALQGVKKIAEELIMTNELIRQHNPSEEILFRPPAGISNPIIKKALKKVPMKVIGWSLRSLDTVRTKEKVVKKVIRDVRAGDIILLHDRVSNSPEILEHILIHLEKKNLKVVALTNYL